jgi:hypothetical protein
MGIFTLLDSIAFTNIKSLVANDIYLCDTDRKINICPILFNCSHLFLP